MHKEAGDARLFASNVDRGVSHGCFPISRKAEQPQQAAQFRLVLHLGPLAGIHDLGGIDGVFVYLLLDDLPVFSDQEVHTASRLILVFVDSVFAGNFAAPVAQQRESDSNLVGEGFVGEGAIHAHTQDLGVGSFQLLQILLEVLHLLRSTAGEGENVKREHDIFLALVIAELYIFQITAVEILQCEIGSGIAHLGHAGTLRLGLG